MNKGYYNVVINTSFAKLISDQDFELIFNINASDGIFNNLSIDIPEDFNSNNFDRLVKLFDELRVKYTQLILKQNFE